MRAGILGLVLACALCVSQAQAAFLNVIADDHVVNVGDPATWRFVVWVQGDGQAQGLNFSVMIGTGLTGEVPAITDVDIIAADTLFGSNNTGQTDPDPPYADSGLAGAWYSATTTNSGYVSPPSLGPMPLAWITIDPVGFSGRFDLLLKDIFYFGGGPYDTYFDTNLPFDTAITNGSVTIVPEPSSLLLMLAGLAGIGMVTVVRRKRTA